MACQSETTFTRGHLDAETTEPFTVMEIFKTLHKDMADNMEESDMEFNGLDISFSEVKTPRKV